MVTVSAPGKLMLLGEHAVVYGRPCLVTAVDRRVKVCVKETADGKVSIDAPQVNDTRFVERAINLAVSDWKIQHHGLWLETQCPFSGKYGLGSSAAVVVATLKALSALFQYPLDTRSLFEAAYRVVRQVQGVGSGFDVAAVSWGSTLYFVQGGKVVESLEGKTGAIPLVVGYSGVKSSSVDLVKQVASLQQKYPEKVERIMSAIGKLVDQARLALLVGDWEKLGKLMDFNQEYLRDLGVSSSKLEDLISSAKKAGAWGAKLSGAGGGDCMIALHPQGPRGKLAVSQAIQAAGGEVIAVNPNAEGVRVETTNDQRKLMTKLPNGALP